MNNILKISKMIAFFEKIVKDNNNSFNYLEKQAREIGDIDIPGAEPPSISRFKEIYDRLKEVLKDKDNETIVAATHAVLSLLSLYPGLIWLDVINAIVFLFENKKTEAGICILSMLLPGLDAYITVKNSLILIKNASLARQFIMKNKAMIATIIGKVATIAGWSALSSVTADTIDQYLENPPTT